MWVELNHTKNGSPASFARVMKSMAFSRHSSSIVSMRFFVRGPVSVIWPSLQWRTPRGA